MKNAIAKFLPFFLGGFLAMNVQSEDNALLARSLEPPSVNTRPGPEYQDEARKGAMIIGMDRTPKGRIWGCWTGTGDNPDAYFILATSDDDGVTWSKPRVVIDPADLPGKPVCRTIVGNLWTDPTGRLWLFFDQSLGAFDGRAGDWFITCDNPDADEPEWSAPVRFADGCTLNKPTVLKNGEWLLPVSLWQRDKITSELFQNAHHDLDSIRMANVFASTDKGRTWARRGGVLIPQTDFDEHMIVELRDGRLWMLARTVYGMAESFSSDSGRTWSEPQPSAIKNPNARFFLRRLASDRLLLVKNGPTDQRLPGRSHLSAFLSDDEGRTWKGGLVLDERNGVSYPDGFESPDGLIHILYDRNRHTDAEILLAKFREEDVLAGKFVSPDAKPRMLANKALGGARGTQALERFDFDGSAEGWTPNGECEISPEWEPGTLAVNYGGGDPNIVSPPLHAGADEGPVRVTLRLKVSRPGGIAIYYLEPGDAGFSSEKKTIILVPPEAVYDFVEVGGELPVSAVKLLRLDPSGTNGALQVDWIEVRAGAAE